MSSGVIVYVLRRYEQNTEVLFLERSGGKFVDQWWPVAGTADDNELPIDTALRELNEETALIPERIYAFNREIRHSTDQGMLNSYVAFVPADSIVKLNYEHRSYRWLAAEEAIAIVHRVAS